MSFSELKLISAETGLNWDDDRLALHGVLRDYPIVIADIPQRREYLLTVFCRVRSDIDNAVASGITELLDKLPANCVAGRVNQLRYQQLRFNAGLLYQENLSYLAELVKSLAELLDGFDLVAEQLDEKIAFPAEKPAPKKQARPQGYVSKRFDKYSVRGFIGALLGAAAMTVLSAYITSDNGSTDSVGGIGAMLSGWFCGALIAFVTLMDYRFLARKMDIFGTLSCSLLTALGCFLGAAWKTVRVVMSYAKRIDPSASLRSVMNNWSLYQLLYPNSTEDFPITLLQFLFSAVVASAAFYIVYYSRHSAIMYSEDGEFIPKN